MDDIFKVDVKFNSLSALLRAIFKRYRLGSSSGEILSWVNSIQSEFDQLLISITQTFVKFHI